MMDPEEFTRFITQKGEELYRSMPWRDDTRPYYVLVSELMLQQTQVLRVEPKFREFIKRFPDEMALGAAELSEVLTAWQGLGYNRRARFLHQAAHIVTQLEAFPDTYEGLIALPGVGKNTAGAILAYSYNKPALFVETNVRTVYLHHFFEDGDDVSDKEILKLLELTLDQDNPRRFYQNIMDYGAWLKQNGVRNIAKSRHYKKQSPLKGSVREVRGQIIRALTEDHLLTRDALSKKVDADDRFEQALSGLMHDKLVTKDGSDTYRL